jgi:hypothetical protein
MKYLLFVNIFISFLCLSVIGQNPSSKVVIEVRQSSAGMIAESGNFLFVRVYDNGQVELEENVIKNNERVFELRQYNLSAARLENLTNFLGKTNIQKIAKEYEPDIPTIDHYRIFEITINRNAESQRIKLTNYSPILPESDDKYPSELVELVCRAQALRFNNDFRLLKNDCILSNKSGK